MKVKAGKLVVEVAVADELYCAGQTEDGLDFVAVVYRVMLEAADGRRWVHPVAYPGAERFTGEDGDVFEDVREAAKAAADRFVARVAARGSVDLSCWQEARAAYGSDAYDVFEDILLERAEG
jgi:hypothetical protein